MAGEVRAARARGPHLRGAPPANRPISGRRENLRFPATLSGESGNRDFGISSGRHGGGLLGPGGAFSDVSASCIRVGFRRIRGPLPGGAVGQISDPVFVGGAGFRALTARVARTSGAGLMAPDFGARTSGASSYCRKLPLPPSATPRSYPPAAPLPPAATPSR